MIQLPYPEWTLAKQRKFPHEYELKGLGFYIIEHPLNKEIEDRFYVQLVNLAKAVINYKYGVSKRLPMDQLAHDIASSLMMTVVVRRKAVYSWTNLMKKVVNDNVSTFLRKEFYSMQPNDSDEEASQSKTAKEVGKIDQDFRWYKTQIAFNEDDYGEDDYSTDFTDRIHSGESYEWQQIKPEDLIFLGQLVERSMCEIKNLRNSVLSLRNMLIFRLALYEVVNRVRHNLFGLLDGKDHIRYGLYLVTIRGCLAPVLSHKYIAGHW